MSFEIEVGAQGLASPGSPATDPRRWGGLTWEQQLPALNFFHLYFLSVIPKGNLLLLSGGSLGL